MIADPRRARWTRLTVLLDRLEDGGAKKLDSAAARELSALYRAASSDLLEELRRDEGGATSEYLRGLVGRAHGMLHRGRAPRIWPLVKRFFVRDFPEVVRRRFLAVLLAAAIFVAGAIFGAISFVNDPGTGEVLLPMGHRYMDASERVESEESGPGLGVLGKSAVGVPFAAQLFTHNSRVTYLCFALAITGGIGIVLVVFANGAYLGAVGAKYILDGQALFFFAWVGPHGVIEIPAILLGAAGGFILTKALFVPGLAGRQAALHAAGRDVMILLIGATVTLLVAGAVEGTFSQIHEPHLPYPLKIAFAVALGGGYWGYLLLWSPEGGAAALDAAGKLRGLFRRARRLSSREVAE